MATVNLEKLSAELTAAGMTVDVYVATYVAEKRLDCRGVTVSPAGNVWSYGTVIDWPSLDIIRRHVAPVAPDPGLREAVFKAIDDSIWAGRGSEVVTATDAVLSVLAERGVR